MPQKYIKVEVREAIEWTGDNHNEISDFIPVFQTPQHNVDAKSWIFNFHGTLQVLQKGNYLLKSKGGEVLAVSKELFLETYTAIDSHLLEIKTGISQAINDVVEVEGEIESVSKIGGSLSIKFKNGNRYSQPLITKNTNYINENP